MSGLTEAGNHNHLSVEMYQRRYTNKTLAVQAALGIIVLSGITLAVLSHYGYIDHVFVYIGTAEAIASALVILGVFVCCKNNNFRKSLNDVRSVPELKVICQNIKYRETGCLDFSIWMGASNYVNVSSNNFSGVISTDCLDTKISWLITSFPNMDQQDKEYLTSLQNSINDHIYGVVPLQ